MKLPKFFTKGLMALATTFACGLAIAGPPGCVGKMWNPLADVDFRLMGGIKIAGAQMMKAPSELGEPPQHKVKAVCFCKNGWKTGFGLGLTYWLPTYLADVARQGGCIGFLSGTNILPGFVSLSSGQEYNHHKPGADGITNMQIHWAYADITAIAGKQLFDSCDAISTEFSIAYLTEPDFIFQNDIYSAVMTPQVAILASSALLSQLACGAESIANTLGGWQDWGVCGWKGTRLPLTANTISKDMAQVSNMDIILKFLTRQALVGAMLRTMGPDTACQAKWDPFYNPFQHRYQWAYPAKVSTRYNVDVVRWGLFIKGGGSKSMEGLMEDTQRVANEKPAENPASPSGLGAAQRIMQSIPKPLNYPTRESGYMHVWEAKTCCLMVLTLQNIAQQIVANIATAGGETLRQLYEVYQYAEKIYKIISDPIGGALGLIGDGIASGISSAGSWSSGLFAAAPAGGLSPLTAGASSGIAASLGAR